MPDAHEALWKQMQQEAAQELIDRQSQQLLFVVVSRIAPTKCDPPVSKRDQAMVRDGHAMGVAEEILEHMLWASERSFRIDVVSARQQRFSVERGASSLHES